MATVEWQWRVVCGDLISPVNEEDIDEVVAHHAQHAPIGALSVQSRRVRYDPWEDSVLDVVQQPQGGPPRPPSGVATWEESVLDIPQQPPSGGAS